VLSNLERCAQVLGSAPGQERVLDMLATEPLVVALAGPLSEELREAVTRAAAFEEVESVELQDLVEVPAPPGPAPPAEARVRVSLARLDGLLQLVDEARVGRQQL